MKEYEKKAPDSTEQDAPQRVVKHRTAGSDRDLLGHDRAPEASPQAHAGALDAGQLSHPANAAPLADLLGQLQHDYGNAYVQRVVSGLRDEKEDAAPKHEATPKPESVQTLDAGTRGEMESAFGESLGDVRLHTGEQAEEAARGLGARAFTHGRDIYFNEGEYDPATRDGKELLAHELTHVIQQQGGTSATQSSSLGQAGDSFEQEADDLAALILRGEHARVEGQGAAPACQRQAPGTRPATVRRTIPLVIHVGRMASGTSAGITYRFSEEGLTFHIDFDMPPGTHFESAEPRERCITTRLGRNRERVTVKRGPQEATSLFISFGQGDAVIVMNMILPRHP